MDEVNNNTYTTNGGKESSVSVPLGDSCQMELKSLARPKNGSTKTMSTPTKNAVEVRNVDLTYGFGIKTNVVLTGMSLNVPEGQVYALIGPSGCGKTSILRCIMGFLEPDAGQIRVFGRKPASPRTFIPGKNLGYMPQDVSLNMNLTVYEMMRYFGKIFLLSKQQLQERIRYLIEMLEIPEGDRFISTLSGGQQRRVSFACAVIHKPKLAILDEPTVGVDPMIRIKIWDFLMEMTREGSTILLTTHYIEETRNADTIGFLRKGYLLAEDSPEKVLKELGVSKLEDAFYSLCINEIERRKKYKAITEEEGDKAYHNYPTLWALIMFLTAGLQQFRRHKPLNADWFQMLFAIVEKFHLQIWRERVILLCWLFIPTVALVVTCACIGPLPEIHLAIINDEEPPQLTKAITDGLDKKIWVIHNYTDPFVARESVEKKEIFAYVHFYSNFSSTLLRFVDLYKNLDEVSANVNFNVFSFHADFANKILLAISALSLYQSFPHIIEDGLRDAGYNPRLLEFPIAYGKSVYGKPLFDSGIDLFDVKNLVIPGCLLYASFSASMLVALYFMRLEKLNNMFERTYSAGVSATQIIVAQFIVRSGLTFFSVSFTLWVAIQFYGVANEGSLLLVMLLMFIQNISGLAYGLMFTSWSTDPVHFIAFAGGSMGAFLFFSGIMWPLEAQPFFFRWIAKFTPLAIPSESLRSIMVRGLPFWDARVYLGLLISIGYFLLFLVGAANFFNLKKL